MSEDVILVAGTLVEHQLSDGTWSRVPNVVSTGETGETAEAKEKTTVGDSIKKYGSGLQEGAEKTLKLQNIPPQLVGAKYEQDRILQQAFIARAKAKEAIRMRVTYPDLERATMDVKLLGYVIDDGSAEDWKMSTISAKANSETVFTESPELTGIAATGSSGGSLSVAGTEQITVTTTPADAWYQADKVFTSSDTGVATVSEGGLVTGVAAGSATITVDMSGQTTTHAVTVA